VSPEVLFRAVEQLDAATPATATGFDSSRARWSALPSLVTRRRVAVLCLALVACRILAVDLAGVVTNDSLGYLRRAGDPFGAGFVTQGYRQAAYPLLISTGNRVGDLVGWDHIFGVALMQRGLLVAALMTLIWALHWWSAPLVAVATSSSFVVHADLVLPEGTLVPASLLLGGLLAVIVRGRANTPRLARMTLIGAVAAVALCASIKLQYAALILVVAAAAWTAYRDRLVDRRFAAITVGSTALFVVLLAAAQSFENRAELGVFEPVSERARAEWYGAWQAVFGVHPDNRDDPDLAEFYDQGNLYTFLHGIERSQPDYRTRARILRDRIDAMFEAAGTSARSEQAAAFLGALRAGRLDATSGIVSEVLGAPHGDSMTRISFNGEFAADDGMSIVADLNDGEPPGIASSGPVLDFSQRLFPDYRGLRGVLSIVTIGLMLASLMLHGRHRLAVAAVLGSVTAIAAALSTGYLDDARYLLAPLALMLVGGTLGLQAITSSIQERLHQRR
jgi:hypothetical protein